MSFEIVYNDALKIFSKLYVGIKPKKGDAVPLAFAAPYEGTKACEKRQGTIQRWVGNCEYIWDPKTRTQTKVDYEPDLRIVDNTPRAGFKVTDEVKRVYYGGGNVVWRIEDPYGWEVEIQSNNLMALLQSVGVSPGGVINGECIWARDGSHNVLIPVSSDEYKNAIKAAESIKPKGKVPAKERVIGRTYRLLDGTFGTYLGKLHVRTASRDYMGNAYGFMKIERQHNSYISPTHCFNNEVHNHQDTEVFEAVLIPEMTVPNGYGNTYTYAPNVKIWKSAPLIEALDDKSCTAEEAEALANKHPKDFASSGKGDPFWLSVTPNPKARYTIRKAEQDEIAKAREELLESMQRDQASYEAQLQNPSYAQYARKPVFTLAGVTTNSDLIMLVDGALYSRAVGITLFKRPTNLWSNEKRESETIHVAGRVLLSDNRMQKIQAQQHNSISPNDNRGRAFSDQWYEGLVLTDHDTMEAALAEFDAKAANNQFYKITTERFQ